MKEVELLNKILPKNSSYISDNIAIKALSSEYNKQAAKFLLDTDTTCSISRVGTNKPSWGSSKVNTYEVELSNKNGNYEFTFYDSINNTGKNISSRYDFYSILCCLTKQCPDSFDEFCSDYGYEFKNESDYIRVKNIHLTCLKEVKMLNKLFTSEQIDKLLEIQ